VGFCSTSKPVRSGFFYDGTRMIKLGTLGGKQTEPFAINNADVIVGKSQTAAGVFHPFVLDRAAAHHPLLDLQTMLDSSGTGWALTEAIAINDAGQILAHGTLAGIKGHTALLTPVD
jgi:uncharacterized membrane protein